MNELSVREGQQILHLPEELYNCQHDSYVIGHVGYPSRQLSPLPSRRRTVCPGGKTNLYAGVDRLESRPGVHISFILVAFLNISRHFLD
jgi:hypothetical protein